MQESRKAGKKRPNPQISCPHFALARQIKESMSDSTSTDASLLADWLRDRRESAFHALVGRYQPLVHAAALRTGGNDSIAAEASQLTFISLAQKARSLRSRATIAGWLHITAVHHTRNLIRHQQREVRKRQSLQTHMETESPVPAQDVWIQMKPVIDDALAALPAQDRDTLLLRFYSAMTVGEIAKAQSIALSAAQKRVDRATKRMRVQLTRRGCTVGGSLASVLLAGFATDAQAALPSASILAAKALAATSATTSLTTISIIAMTQKTTLTAAAAILLVGAGTAALIYKDAPDQPAVAEQTTAPSAPSASSFGSAAASADNPRASRTKTRRDPAENPELVSKYGESRTVLSKRVATNVITLLDDVISMGDMVASGELSEVMGGNKAAFKRALGGVGDKLELTDDQQEQGAALYAEFQKRELEKSRASVDLLKKDPTALMQAMLASDAFSRGQISEAEFKQAQASSSTDLKGVMNPLENSDKWGGTPTKDPTFSRDFQALLDPTQIEIYEAATASEETDSDGQTAKGDISNLPAMELEKLDDTIIAAQKMTGGIKQMMEGMGGLKDLGPLLQQQQQQGGQDSDAEKNQ